MVEYFRYLKYGFYSVYISSTQEGDPCAVKLIYNLVRNKIFGLGRIHIHSQGIFEKAINRKNKKNISIFAHPKSDFLGFSSNPYPNYISIEDFKSLDSFPKLIYLHSCSGEKVLNKNISFKNWVSYKRDISIRFGIPDDENFLKKLFREIEKSVLRAKNPIDLEICIKQNYEEANDRLRKLRIKKPEYKELFTISSNHITWASKHLQSS